MAPLSCSQFQRYVRHKYDVIKFSCDDLEKVISEYNFEPNDTLLEWVNEAHGNVKNICQNVERVLLEFAKDKLLSQDVASSDVTESRLYQLLTQGSDPKTTPNVEISLAPKIEPTLAEEIEIEEDLFEPVELNNPDEIVISDSDSDELNQIKCKIKGCLIRFSNIEVLTNHVLYEHQVTDYNCKKCSQNVELSNLTRHECNISRCKILGCDDAFLTVSERNHHMLYSHGKKYQKNTEKKISYKNTLKNGSEFEHSVKCPFKGCDKYLKEFSLASHIKQCH